MMYLRSGCASALLALILIFPLPAFADQASALRAIWIWEHDTHKLMFEPVFRAGAITFLQDKGINTIYLFVDDLTLRSPRETRELVAQLHEQGFTVHALLCSRAIRVAELALPENRDRALALFDSLLAYNAASPTAAQFSGVSLDIEPYQLAEWDTRRDMLLRSFLDLGAALMQRKNEAGVTLAIGPAIPFWYDGLPPLAWRGTEKLVSEHIQDIYDYVVIMDYRDKAAGRDSILSHAQNELAYGDLIGRPVVVAVETQNEYPRKITFYDENEQYMEEQLALAGESLQDHSSYAGIAIHHFGTYRAWSSAQVLATRQVFSNIN